MLFADKDLLLLQEQGWGWEGPCKGEEMGEQIKVGREALLPVLGQVWGWVGATLYPWDLLWGEALGGGVGAAASC